MMKARAARYDFGILSCLPGIFLAAFGLLKKGLQGQPLHRGCFRCPISERAMWISSKNPLAVRLGCYFPTQKFVNLTSWIWETKRGCSSHTGFACPNFRVTWFLSQLWMKFQSWDLRTWCGKGGSSRSFGGDPCWGCEVDVLCIQISGSIAIILMFILYISLYNTCIMYIIYIYIYVWYICVYIYIYILYVV